LIGPGVREDPLFRGKKHPFAKSTIIPEKGEAFFMRVEKKIA
jgi:hypothetical protein